MRHGLRIVALVSLLVGCLQSTYPNAPDHSPVPGGPTRLLEERPGSLLVRAGAKRDVAAKRLADRLRDPGQGGFGFSNRPMARRILKVLRG